MVRARSHVRSLIESATDSELDSDSGYSSPMHRKHHGSATHHSVATASTQCQTHSATQPPWMPSPMTSLYAQALLQDGQQPKNTETTVNTKHLNAPSSVANIAASNKQTAPTASLNTSEQTSLLATESSNCDRRKTRADANTQLETGDSSSQHASGTKPKRKRSRRRKKGGESGALSDSGTDLVRAHSSSNVSRTSTVDNDFLHFEDENEFPNLLSAVGGLQSDAQQLGPVSVSYCDILKGQAFKVIFTHVPLSSLFAFFMSRSNFAIP